jgi:hypothetical protein
MSTDDDQVLSGRIRTMQIILSALVAGCLVFMIIAVTIRQGGQMNLPPVPIITYVALGFGVIMVLQSLIIPGS